jgi:flagellar biosynthetic protein FliP
MQRSRFGIFAWGVILLALSTAAFGQTSRNSAKASRPSPVRPIVDEQLVPPAPAPANGLIPAGLNADDLTSPQGLSSSLKVMLLLTVLSLAPSILIMTTCFVRFVVVLTLLRQALGTQQLPPNQVVISLCLFLTCLVMAPVWNRAYEEGVRPYTSPAPGDAPLDEATALARTLAPLREFMADQIERADNSDAVWMFLDFQAGSLSFGEQPPEPQSYDDVPLSVLLPAYMLSELKVAFLIGFQIYLPFIVIDMVISSLLISMGMMMMPPVLVSLPFKLLLFVLIDGWTLTVGMLLESVRPTG